MRLVTKNEEAQADRLIGMLERMKTKLQAVTVTNTSIAAAVMFEDFDVENFADEVRILQLELDGE